MTYTKGDAWVWILVLLTAPVWMPLMEVFGSCIMKHERRRT